MTTVCFFHTVAGLSRRFDELAEEYLPTDIEHFHVVDESTLDDLLEQDELTPSIRSRICTQMDLAQRGGADIVLDTCSSTSPAVDTARDLVDVPIVKIDDPMTERAVELGDRIAVVATASSTLGPSTELVQRKADQRGADVTVEPSHVEGALDARTSGDVDRHDELVSEQVRDLAGEYDVIVLAQASMSHLRPKLGDDLSVPILSSPHMAMKRLVERVNEVS